MFHTYKKIGAALIAVLLIAALPHAAILRHERFF